jgi:mono/diheme cytochrome c family protein
VPAYKVYSASKHGNIHAALKANWDFDAVPWKAGKDFTAPTCATCHISLVAGEGGAVVAQRTHRMNDRLGWRLFGLIYAHPHPLSPDTTAIKTPSGLPLPTELTGELAAKYLIGEKERGQREAVMKGVCRACHATGWADGHFARLGESIATTNQMTLAATKVLLAGYEKKLIAKESLFDEPLEKLWTAQWLFYANSTRLASAMCGADYGAFEHGRWHLSENLAKMLRMMTRGR